MEPSGETDQDDSKNENEAEYENTLTKHRWACICSDVDVCVWDKKGLPQFVEDLPVTPTLQRSLEAWSLRCEGFDDEIQGASVDKAMGSEVELPIEDWEPLGLEGFDLACAVKRALPGWTVQYWDRAAFERGRTIYPTKRRPEVQYEIVLDSDGQIRRPID
jgi:hypothetical protein